MPKTKSSLSRRTSDAIEEFKMRGCERLMNNDRINYIEKTQRNSTVCALGDLVQTELRLLQERVQIGERRTRESLVQRSTRLEQSRSNRLQNVSFLGNRCGFNYNCQLDIQITSILKRFRLVTRGKYAPNVMQKNGKANHLAYAARKRNQICHPFMNSLTLCKVY